MSVRFLNTVGVWNLRPDAEHGDLVFLKLAEVGSLAEDNAPGVGSGSAADDVKQGRLAGAVGTDQGAQFAVIDVEIDFFQRLEAIERDGDVLHIHDGAAFFQVSLLVSRRTGSRLTPVSRLRRGVGSGRRAGTPANLVRNRRIPRRHWGGNADDAIREE